MLMLYGAMWSDIHDFEFVGQLKSNTCASLRPEKKIKNHHRSELNLEIFTGNR